MNDQPARQRDARSRILETADRLFYAEGVRAIGIDRIIAEAGVAKMSLYKHFASKDDLILAVLAHREEHVNAVFAEGVAGYRQQGKSGLDAFFATLEDWFSGQGFRGCAFINTRVELADPAHPAARYSAGFKHRFREMLGTLLADDLGADRAAQVLPAVALLLEGAIVTAVMDGSAEPARVAHEAARTLIAAQKG